MLLPGPHHSVVYLRLDAPATLRAGAEGARVRVLRDTGYPHDLKVAPGRPAVLKPGRTFTPVADAGVAIELDAADVGEATALVLCANCFAELWRRPLAWPPTPVGLAAAEEAFWAEPGAHACPRCHAAAALPH